MPCITQIKTQKRRPHRRSVYLDGSFAFACHLNVILRFGLQEGLILSENDLIRIRQGEVRQECFDRAVKYLEKRLHSRKELADKLKRQEYPPDLIESVLDQLSQMGYVNDERFSETRLESAARYKRHGPHRARLELIKKGVESELARQMTERVYESHDMMSMARELAKKKSASWSRLDPQQARRRLYGLLLRRGFDYDTIRPVVEEVLGKIDQHPESDF